MACNCRVVFSCISATSWNRFPFRVIFSLGKRKKSKGAKSGESGGWGTTGMLCLAKNSLTLGAAWHGALSWCRSQVSEDHLWGRFRRTACAKWQVKFISNLSDRQTSVPTDYSIDTVNSLVGSRRWWPALCVDHCHWTCGHFWIGNTTQMSWIDSTLFLRITCCSISYVSVAVLPSFWQNLMQTRCSFNTSIWQHNGGTNTIAL
jgi:hypothetical protein